ncbi:MAG TPA: hypothetical protein VFW96_06805 [Thermomicrobiales bacterium]|nr:hypothetical protein [Thermomicrobiales bacterium]
MSELDGGIVRLRPKPGREQELLGLLDDWWRERAPRAPGARASYALTPGLRGDRLSVAVFGDRASDLAGTVDPARDHWYRRLRDALEADPEWENGAAIGA